ncbi:magnesium transporter CorA [Streptomyces kurssanovii]|nr:magnesium transporter CorA [Streptomyces kurssanovii]
MARTRLYRNGTLVLENFPADDISEHLTDPASVVWLDLHRPSPNELAMAGEQFGIHELALEDALHQGQRPKLDRYCTHEFLSTHAVSIAPDSADLSISEISAFLTGQALITIRKDDGFPIEDVVARWDESPDMAEHGVDFLLHGLLDHVVDGHVDAVQQLDDRIEDLEDLLFAERQQMRTVNRRLYALRRSLARLRRVVLPMREVVDSLVRPGRVTDPLVPYYKDVYDHVLRAIEWTESVQDMVASAMESNLSVQSNRMNLIMKKVTSWAAIIAVPTAITGFYGQNLPYPGFAREMGFITSTTAIVILSALLYVVFKRKDWL